MKCFRLFPAIIAALGVTCIADLAAPSVCVAQSDSVNIYTDQGNYYGTGYNGAYTPSPSRRVVPTTPRYSNPTYSGYPGVYPFGNAGPFNNHMGPNVSAINGPFGNMYGFYEHRYTGANGMPMTYYGSYGFRGFDR